MTTESMLLRHDIIISSQGDPVVIITTTTTETRTTAQEDITTTTGPTTDVTKIPKILELFNSDIQTVCEHYYIFTVVSYCAVINFRLFFDFSIFIPLCGNIITLCSCYTF